MRDNDYHEDSECRSANTEPAALFARLLEIVLRAHGMACVVDVYCDGSGTHHNSLFLTAAGYLFDPEQVKLFDQEWREALRGAGIQRPFHMYDCAH
jgi:hypothetical protein